MPANAPPAAATPAELARVPLRGLAATFTVLASTRNEAAVEVLLDGLNSSDHRIQQASLTSLLKRRSLVGHRAILARLHQIDDAWRAILDENNSRLGPALHEAIRGSDQQLCINACQAVLWFKEYDLMPALLHAAEDENHAQRDLAAQTALQLAEFLYQDLSGTPGSTGKRRHDPQLIRGHVLHTLEQSLRRYPAHKRPEVIEAFLLLVNRDNSILKDILGDPLHTAYLPVVDALTHSRRTGIMRLLLSYLDDPTAPSSAINIMARRTDQKFVEGLVRKIGAQPSPAAAQNIRRIEHITWLERETDLIDTLDDAGQHGAVQLALKSNSPKPVVFHLLERLIRFGKPGGRRAAAAALAGFHGAEANALAVEAMEDPDPQVQAHVLRQLRPRGVPGALAKLLAMLDSPYEAVRKATRESLEEFSFARYAAAFEMLDEHVRVTTGAMVRKVDLEAPKLLLEELDVRSRTRRLKALGMAAAMDLVERLQSPIIERLDDEDHLVRAEAAKALAKCKTQPAREALERALADRSIVVQEAAQKSLDVLSLLRDKAKESTDSQPAFLQPVCSEPRALASGGHA